MTGARSSTWCGTPTVRRTFPSLLMAAGASSDLPPDWQVLPGIGSLLSSPTGGESAVDALLMGYGDA